MCALFCLFMPDCLLCVCVCGRGMGGGEWEEVVGVSVCLGRVSKNGFFNI